MQMNSRQIAAQIPPVWTGDLDDDCTAMWAGYQLLAEWMNGDYWWWCVIESSTGEQIITSDNSAERYHSGESARLAAETAARRLLGFKD